MGQDPVTGYVTCNEFGFQVPCGRVGGSVRNRGGWKEFFAGAGHWAAVAIDDLPKASWWCWIEDCSVGAEDAYEKFISTKGVDTDTDTYKDTQTALDIASTLNVAGLARKLLKSLRKLNDAPSLPSGCKCFLAGTLVLMADGTEERIDDLELGDKVLATDPESGEQGPREVTSLIVTQDDKYFNELSIATEEGIETLTATHEHPFWSPSENDWIEARDLKRGTTLLTDDGQTVIVTGNRSYSKSATTYNLTIDDLHTYYVLAGQTPVLVHNSDGCSTHVTGKGDDPLVPELVDDINARYPGHVRAQGVNVVGADGKTLTDFDIVTRNAVVQVKTGNGKGALKQALKTQSLTDYPVIVYLPEGRGSVIKSLEQAGIMVTRDKNTLLDVLAP